MYPKHLCEGIIRADKVLFVSIAPFSFVAKTDFCKRSSDHLLRAVICFRIILRVSFLA